MRILAEELNSSYCTICTILTEGLGKRKVCARFVLHQLNEDQKSQRIFYEKTDLSSTTLRIRLIYHRVPIENSDVGNDIGNDIGNGIGNVIASDVVNVVVSDIVNDVGFWDHIRYRL